MTASIRIGNIISSSTLPDGNVVIQYDNSSKYVGQVNGNGEFHGIGYFEDEFKNHYTGEFQNGKKHGKCMEKWWDMLFQGMYNEGNREGYGKETYRDGEYSIGNYINNKRDGEFVFKKLDGFTTTRSYVYGELYIDGEPCSSSMLTIHKYPPTRTPFH